MSRFRDLLKQHFEDNKINIVQFSHKCGIDRTTIQHMIGNRKNYRLPSLEVFRIVLDHLPITPSEGKYLKELFMVEKIGVYNYEGRKCVRNIIEQIAWLHNYSDHRYVMEKSISAKTDNHTGLYKGANTVNSIINAVFAEEVEGRGAESILRLNVPFSFLYLKQMLLQTCWESNRQFSIRHVVTLSKAPAKHINPNINLNTISDILPFSFCMDERYQARYYYTNLEPENELLLVMPYYIITETRLVLLSNDFSSAMLIDEPSLIQEYSERFEQSFQQCQSLIEHIADPVAIFETYADCMTDGCDLFAIESNPCILHHLSEDIIFRTVRWEVAGADKLTDTFTSYIKKYSQMKTYNYFSVAGLAQLARKGRLAIFSKELVKPFTIPDRIAILESIYKSIQNGGSSRLIDSSKLAISQKAVISTTNNDTLQFYWCEKDNYHYCIIKEPSIVASFVDFFESLPQGDLIFSAEETLVVLASYINELKAELQ